MLNRCRAGRRALAVILVGCATIAAGRAAAAESDDPPAAAVAPGARTHDGFYLRIGNGFGAFDERLSAGSGDSEVNARNRGIGTLGELALGGTIAPGWVLGGGVYACDVLAATFRSSGADVPAELDPGLRNAGLIAAFVDVYPDPHRGLHFQGALGLATLTPRVFGHPATERSEYLALGAGLMFGAGYEVWIADEWSLGVLARTTVAFVAGDDELGTSFRHLVLTSPGLLVTLTYH